MLPPFSKLGLSSARSDFKIISVMLPYIWPHNAPILRIRVLLALFFLAMAKLFTVAVPMMYKEIIDALEPANVGLIIPVGLVISYGVCRILSEVFGELRDAIFTRVAQGAIRRTGLKTFRHLHALSMRFHIDRKTGGITRAIDRGTKGIEFFLLQNSFCVSTSAQSRGHGFQTSVNLCWIVVFYSGGKTLHTNNAPLFPGL